MNKYLLILVALFFTSCGYVDKLQSHYKSIKHDLAIDQLTKSVIKGTINDTTPSAKDIYVILYKYNEGDIDARDSYKLVDFSMHSKNNKEFSFDVSSGLYYIYACQNLEELREEKYAYVFQSYGIDVKLRETKNLNIYLDPNPTKVPDENKLISSLKEKSILSDFGEVRQTTLDNPVFNRENAKLGLWRSDRFLNEVGGGLYYFDEYEAGKEAILFVHGINGTPLDFSTIIEGLDREKYFPIVYYYASGANLNYSAEGLRFTIEKLLNKYSFDEIILVAHSMGGLVSRGFINNNKNIKISKFITIATPWNGNNFAKLGGEEIKYIVPSFGNMIPGSAYITNNLNIPLPEDMQHYLLFSYKGRNAFVLESSNDGVISLSSQLHEKVLQKAHKVYGFNETHAGVLRSESTISYINQIIQ